jgi:D-alanyl-D-alanine carboxypeptidase (penicillin-binding protein 5/6)
MLLTGALLCVVLALASAAAAGTLGWLDGVRLPLVGATGPGEGPTTSGAAAPDASVSVTATPIAAAAPVAPKPGVLPAAVRPPAVKAAGWVLADEATGQVLAARDPAAARPMASTTKVMTGLLTLEAGGNLDRVVTIGAAPAAVGDSSIKLKRGERLTVRQLLQALLLKSANDAAVALAEAVDGSEAAFVKHMNARAAELRLDSTHFASPHGLDRPGHHTSPRDLARLWETAMRQRTFRELVGTRTARLPGGPAELRAITTTNELLGSYPWLLGGKTGFTDDAGRCLVASAERGGRRLVAVALGSTNAFTDVRALLEYGFTGFVRARVADAGQTVTVQGGPASGWRVPDPVDVLVRRDLLGRLAVTAAGPVRPDGRLPARFSAGGQELASAVLSPADAAGGGITGAATAPTPLDPEPVPAGERPATVDPFLADAA